MKIFVYSLQYAIEKKQDDSTSFVWLHVVSTSIVLHFYLDFLSSVAGVSFIHYYLNQTALVYNASVPTFFFLLNLCISALHL